MNEITYTLKDTFQYAFKGDMREAQFITLKGPNVATIGYMGRLKQGFMKALSSQDSGQVSQEDLAEARQEMKNGKGMELDDLDGIHIMALLAVSDQIEYQSYLQTAKEAFIHPDIGLIDGEQVLNKSLIAKVSFNDFEEMTGEYLKAFIVASALKAMQI